MDKETLNKQWQKLKEFMQVSCQGLAFATGKTIKCIKDGIDKLDSWYDNQEESIQEMTSLFIALLITILLRALIFH